MTDKFLVVNFNKINSAFTKNCFKVPDHIKNKNDWRNGFAHALAIISVDEGVLVDRDMIPDAIIKKLEGGKG